jgi:hypothetical protein
MRVQCLSKMVRFELQTGLAKNDGSLLTGFVFQMKTQLLLVPLTLHQMLYSGEQLNVLLWGWGMTLLEAWTRLSS